MADDLGERTEEATPRRRQEARDEGNVARSQDLAAALLLLGATAAVWVGGSTMLGQGQVLLGQVLDSGFISDPVTPDGAWPMVRTLGAAGLRIAAPAVLIVWTAGILAQLLQIGWLFSPKSLAPKLSKLNPLDGAKRIFGLSGLVKVSLDSLKVLLVMIVAVLTITQYATRIVQLPVLMPMEAVAVVGRLMLDLALRVLAMLLLLGVFDYLYQRWKHARDLRMTRQQVKDEMKQTEGDPDVRRRRFRMQQQIAMQRISAAVPKADVVVTNPEHIAVAIQYDAASMAAPRVVAKGADYLALRIRQIALRHGVPIVERKPLARALYRAVEVNQEIPPDFYKAVAEILAYVYRLNGKAAG